MTAISTARRLFLKRAAVGAALAPVIGADVARAATMHASGGGHIVPGMGAFGGPIQQAGSASGGIAGTALRAIQHGFYDRQKETAERAFYRIGWFDPDIAALSSTSHAFKLAKQRERDRESQGMLEKMRRMAWPED